jgi:hypothetical protein
MGRLGVYGPILGRLPLRVFSIGKYAFQKKRSVHASPASMVMCMSNSHDSHHDNSHDDVTVELNFRVTRR